MRALIWVQHLLGTGHTRRAALIARALAAAGFDVTVAQGGFPVPGATFGAARVVQLPPVRVADPTFQRYLDAEGRAPGPAWEARRAALLLELAAAFRPDVLLLETYPFGRRRFRFELAPLLAAIAARRPRPVVAASVRDILVTRRDPAWEAEVAALARTHCDLVLVHGLEALVSFDATFPPAGRLADRLRYTGYVAPPRTRPARTGDGVGEVVVSVGGGAVGLPLLQAALAARPLSRLARVPWRLLAGPDVPADAVADLRRGAPPGVIVEPARGDFPDLLARCAMSISQAGYNTVVDVLQAGCRAVLVPFAAGGETEQGMRARLLAERGRAEVVDETALSPAALAAAVARALAAPAAPPLLFAADGAAVTARLLSQAVERRRAVVPTP